MTDIKRVLIIGGGFGGVSAALHLVHDPRFAVSLLSEDTDMRYYPTLYQTATGGNRASSSIPLSKLFEHKDITLIQSTAETIDRTKKQVITTNKKTYDYDILLLGLGVVTNYFGIPGLPEYAYSIKTQAEVARFKAHLHKQVVDDGHLDLNYVIIGAGPTGIELAGALPAYLRHIVKNHGIKQPRSMHIDIIEALPRLLPRSPKDTSRAVARRLKKLGVKVYLGSAVQAETADELTVNGKPIRSHTVVWTAGVTNHPFFSANNFMMTKRGKVVVDFYLQAEDNIYVIGDNANTPYSGMAQTALHDGKFVAENLIRQANGKNPKSYAAKMPISVIPAGPKWAAFIWGGLRMYGWLGYTMRSMADLVGFHDLEPWPAAIEQWLNEFSEQEECVVCAIATSR
jgi:NADH dehydrogenase